MGIETIGTWKCFGGTQGIYRHASEATGTDMRVSVFMPPESASPPPVLYWLSGLTCTEENFTVKAGAQRYAAEHGLAIVAPDTSPRGEGVANVDDYDFGQGAGFYVDATQAPWAEHFRMYSYVSEELPALIAKSFAVDGSRQGICGHSMGGHGALTVAMRNPQRFRALSAVSPIVAPSRTPWGEKALAGYLGEDREAWLAHDACALVETRGWGGDILVDQGTDDEFLADKLRPELFEEACGKAGVPLTLRMQEGYDHSYYFVATVIGDHIAWHAERLKRD
ncbi:S-formylglutathione hydrolase [Kaustia mangrovi]|uniref:S-formylglutathione hydrolase n=1 Tax=Kaustia mangrovi TaxID=2593653 RepID=A0A7S8C7J6_9HYPH|nr:S-formylglutathione hydrolase [Kaustia mangrovi]QPC44870.1 S-formylglutathione hydrolase [Kaustia mangrovi]